MSNSYFTDVYSKRLNRYGNDYQSRIEGKRAREFEGFLLKSPNRVDFEFDGELVAGILEQYKQDHSETQGCLLTRKETKLPNGTIINLVDKEGNDHYWMVWWLEQIKTSGYHRYIVLKMNRELTWRQNERTCRQWSYLVSPGTKMIRDSVVSGQDGAIFMENNNAHMFITPYRKDFERDLYVETKNGEKTSAFRVVEFDHQATEGVTYLTVEPIAKKDNAPISGDDGNFFWLTGGKQ